MPAVALESHRMGFPEFRPFNERCTMSEDDTLQPTGRSRRAIHATCTVHGGSRGFVNLVIRKLDGTIELDPHVTGQCVLRLAEDEAIALRDQLTEWLG